MSVKVKICGNTRPEDAKEAVRLGADYLGLIFAESKRRITVPEAKKIIAGVSGFQNFVGVFADQLRDEVLKIAEALNLNLLQFHGSEAPEFCDYFIKKKFQVIKTIKVRDESFAAGLSDFKVPYFLLDAYSPRTLGGSGKAFDWEWVSPQFCLKHQVFLAGGLTAENVRGAIQQVRPYAVDAVSGVESRAGIKDWSKLKKFMAAVKGV